MKFTKEEISLCKQVAEKYRKEINKGDWILLQEILCLIISSNENEIGYIEYNHDELISYLILTGTKRNKEKFVQTQSKKWFPLWTISDCLEFFEEQGYSFERAIQLGSIFDVSFISVKGTTKKGSGDTILEACLKAILAVLKEK